MKLSLLSVAEAALSITSRLKTAFRQEAELNQGHILDTVTTAIGQKWCIVSYKVTVVRKERVPQ
jgi:hypothetical protein